VPQCPKRLQSAVVTDDMVAKYRRILSNPEEDGAQDASTKPATSSSNQPTSTRLIILAATNDESMRSDLAKAQGELHNLQEKCNVQPQLIAMLVQSNAGWQMELAIIEDSNELLRQTAAEYKKNLLTTQEMNYLLEQHVKDMNLHVKFLQATKKDLTEHNEMLQDQLAIAYLTPFVQQMDDIKKDEAFALEKFDDLPTLKSEPEDCEGYAFMARTYYPTPICSDSDYHVPSYASLPSPSMEETEWDDDEDLWNIITRAVNLTFLAMV
jgi:hypothetical protein